MASAVHAALSGFRQELLSPVELPLPRGALVSLPRAMAECGSSQIPGIFGEAALILNSEEDELKKMTALALVIEVRQRGIFGQAGGLCCPHSLPRAGISLPPLPKGAVPGAAGPSRPSCNCYRSSPDVSITVS